MGPGDSISHFRIGGSENMRYTEGIAGDVDAIGIDLCPGDKAVGYKEKKE